jgi:hypothetical protein
VACRDLGHGMQRCKVWLGVGHGMQVCVWHTEMKGMACRGVGVARAMAASSGKGNGMQRFGAWQR